MEEKLSKKLVKYFVLATKVLPVLIAAIHFLNMLISFLYGNDIFLNYIGSISLLPILYLYFASYTFKLCEYYRMFLHYTVVVNIINIYDYYHGIPISDITLFMIGMMLTIILMFIVIYLKFLKK
jgi:hypothetical protein